MFRLVIGRGRLGIYSVNLNENMYEIVQKSVVSSATFMRLYIVVLC